MNKRTMLMIGGGALVLLVVAGVIFFVVRRSQPEAAEEEAAKDEAAVAPPVDVLKGQEELVTSKALVSEKGMKERKEQKLKEYITDPKLPAGTLRGVCFVPFDRDVKFWPPFPLELTGENAIKDPGKGELDYYLKRQPLPSVWLGANVHGGWQGYDAAKKRYPVRGVVITLKGIEAGRRGRLDRVSFFVDYKSHNLLVSRPQGETVCNDSWHTIGVMPVMQPVQFVNFGLYDCRYVGTEVARGEVIFDELLKGYSDPSFPGDAFGTNLGMKPPVPQQTRPIRRTGIYTVACKRHPWQKAHLVIADNPYVTVSKDAWGGDVGEGFAGGEFIVKDLPPGKHTVEVWHPEYQPVQKVYEVEIKQDQNTELPIEFKVPPILNAEPRAYPTNNIMEWAFTGPIEAADEDTEKEVRKLNFAASYRGLKDRVGWHRVEATKNEDVMTVIRCVDKDSKDAAAFYAVTVLSDKPQKMPVGSWSFGGHWGLSRKIWVNGKLINYADAGEFPCRDYHNMISTVDLKAGENTLLVKMAASILSPYPSEDYFSVSLPDGIKTKVPDAVKGSGSVKMNEVDLSPAYPCAQTEADKQYDPEIEGQQDKVEWKKVSLAGLNTRNVLGDTQNAVSYMRVILDSSDKCDIHPVVWSDNGMTVFVNGKKVFRGDGYGFNDFDMTLVKGRNIVLFRVPRGGARFSIAAIHVNGAATVTHAR